MSNWFVFELLQKELTEAVRTERYADAGKIIEFYAGVGTPAETMVLFLDLIEVEAPPHLKWAAFEAFVSRLDTKHAKDTAHSLWGFRRIGTEYADRWITQLYKRVFVGLSEAEVKDGRHNLYTMVIWFVWSSIWTDKPKEFGLSAERLLVIRDCDEGGRFSRAIARMEEGFSSEEEFLAWRKGI